MSTTLALAAQASLLEINATLFVELIAFILMVLVLGHYVYPLIISVAESRQKQIEQQLAVAEQARLDAQTRLAEATAQLEEARGQASDIIEGAKRSGDQLRAELSQKAHEEAARLTELAGQEIESERLRALESVRGEVADLVVAATEKVVGETLDDGRHRKLIDKAIREVGKSGDRSR